MSCCSESTHQGPVEAPMLQQPSYHAKVVFAGTSGVGKTSIVGRLVTDQFTGDSPPTIGAAYGSIPIDNYRKLQLWDTAGQERYSPIVPIYFRGAQIVVLVYSVVDSSSYEQMRVWYTKAKELVPEAIIIIVGNKEDLLEEATHTIHPTKVATEYPDDVRLFTSAYSGEGISDLREKLLVIEDTLNTNI